MSAKYSNFFQNPLHGLGSNNPPIRQQYAKRKEDFGKSLPSMENFKTHTREKRMWARKRYCDDKKKYTFELRRKWMWDCYVDSVLQ